MDDMPKKIPYYVNSGGKPKFKRAVPADIRGLVGKQNWVKSVGTLSQTQLRVEGNRFAAHTDAEIERWRKASSDPAASAADHFHLSLRDNEVEEIIERYRSERENSRLRDRSYFFSSERPASEVLQEAEEDLEHAIEVASGGLSATGDFALKLLMRYGYAGNGDFLRHDLRSFRRALETAEKSPAFERLRQLIELVDVQLARSRRQALAERDLSGVPAIALTHPGMGSDTKRKSVTLQHLTDEYLRSKSTSLTVSRKSQLSLPIRVLLEWFEPEKLIAEIDREQCRELVEFLPKTPPYHAQHHKGSSVKEAAEAYAKKHGEYADRSKEAHKYLQVIRSVFKFAVDERWTEHNLFSGLKIDKKPVKKYQEAEQTYQPFPVQALNKLFSLPIFKGENGSTPQRKYFLTHRYWAPIVALFSGMRMNEILQLEKADVHAGEGDVAVICVTDQEDGEYDPEKFHKRVKTENSIRRIPVHPALVDFGFLRWVRLQESGRLFPEAVIGAGEKPSDLYSKRFRTDLKNAGIWQARRQVFHSFRNNFNDALREGKTPTELREAINGWSLRRSMDSQYGAGYSDQALYEEIKKVAYPGLEISCFMENVKFIHS